MFDCLVCCSDYVYFLNVTVAGVYNQNYPGTGQAFKVRSLHCEGCWVPVGKLILQEIRDWLLLQCNMLSVHHALQQIACTYSSVPTTYSSVPTTYSHYSSMMIRSTGKPNPLPLPIPSINRPPSFAVQAYNCRAVYFEDSDVWGTAPGGWGLTYIAVQYGHICRSKVHHADWCFGLTGNPMQHDGCIKISEQHSLA
jgi:hypothetical protein